MPVHYGLPILQKYKKAIENVQRRATRMIPTLRNLNYTERLRNLGLPSLEYRRERADMFQVFKIMNKINQPSRPIITLSENNRTRGNEYKLYKKRSKTELRKNFFQQ